MSLESSIVSAAVNGDKLSPELLYSSNYKHWITIIDWKRCFKCITKHGEIFSKNATVSPHPPIHPFCRCKIETMISIKAGTATINGTNGADWLLRFNNELPNYYITQEELALLGWRKGDKVSKYAMGKMLFGGIYKNRNQHLPQVEGRIWYEADINYKAGKRNCQRILWSNDGLLFATYDHYATFYEII